MVRGRPIAGLGRLVPMVLLVGLTGCADGEGFDPAGWVTGPVAAPERITVEGFDPDAPFPSLARVPTVPPRPTPKRDRAGLVQGLTTQRSNARYTTGSLQPGGLARPAAPTLPGIAPPPEPAMPSRRLTAPGPEPIPPLPANAPSTDAAERENLIRATPPAARPSGASASTLAKPGSHLAVGQLVAVFYFDGGASDLNPADQVLIKEVALLHRQRGGLLRVVGHAAPRAMSAGPGSWGLTRLRLSLARAAKVARNLAALGSAAENLVVVAAADIGEGQVPTAGTGDARHHRVEIFLEE